MKEISLMHKGTAMVDDEDYEVLSQFNWYQWNAGNRIYAKCCIPKEAGIGKGNVWMHRLILLPEFDEEIDHIDGNGLNNQKSNLRVVTRRQNGMNLHPKVPKSSRFPGVYWDNNRGKWRANIRINGKATFLGHFTTEEEARDAYCEASEKLTGDSSISLRSCRSCGHHKGRKTFHETCPRLGELLFKGGTKSAKVLMDETAGHHPCLFWISKEADRFGPCPEKNSMGTCMHGAYSCPHKTEEARAAVGCTYPIQPHHYAGDMPILRKPTKKSPSEKPKSYTIHIERSAGNHPYIIACDSSRFGGTSNPCDTREEVIKRALVTLDGFVHNVKKSTLSKKPLPVTIETTLFIDKTGMFTITDFFDEKGEPRKPVLEPKKSASKKSKKEVKNHED